MIDRLQEVLDLAKKNSDGLIPEEPLQVENDKDLLDYVAKIQLVQNYTNEIDELMSKLKITQEEVTIAVGEREKIVRKDIEEIMETVLHSQGKCNAVLKMLNQKLTDTKKNDPEGKNSTTRIKSNLYGAYSKLYQETINNFEDVQSDIKAKLEGKVLRDAEIVLNRKIDPTEREAVLNDTNYVQKLLSDKLTGTGHIKLQNAVTDIQDRYNDILKLENSVNQVHKLFMEMAILVQHQGEMIDNIESNVKQAKAHVIEAEKNIIESKKNMISARKKKCCILIIVLVILLVIVLPIIGVKFF